MRIYLQMPANEGNPPRYHQFVLQEDLLGGWTLIKESGRQDGGGRIKREYYVSRDEAERALTKARDAQVARGYQVVFVQGERPAQSR
ncbi:MAG: WGR domain-containing protein [Pseudomonadota bacterium]